MSKPKWTDAHRFTTPYVSAEASKEVGYLARRFAEIRERQQKNDEEDARKVAPMKKAKAA